MKKTGFVNANQVFYHSGVGSIEAGEVFKKLTGLPTPHPEAVPFLQEAIFKTQEKSFVQSLLKEESFSLSKDEIIALQKFLEQTNEHFFEIFVVEENPNNAKEFLLTRRNNKITPVYLDKNQQGIAEKVREMYGEQYKILPTKLYLPTLTNKGLLQGAPLFEMLSKAKDMPAEMLTTMMAESGNAELQQKVLSKIDKIVLKQGVTYEKSSFEHQALQVFRHKDADYSALRAKIFIERLKGGEVEGLKELVALNTIAFEPTVSFSLEKVGKFTLQLAEILPAFAEHQAFLEEIFAQIQDYEAPNSLKKRCFEYEERSANLIFNDLKKSFVQLENTAQLAFLWLHAKANNQERILKDFQVLNQAGEWIGLGEFEMWHTKGADFIDTRAILSQECYAGLAEILHLNEKRGAFEVGNQKIVIEPYFEKDAFYASPINKHYLPQNQKGTSYAISTEKESNGWVIYPPFSVLSEENEGNWEHQIIENSDGATVFPPLDNNIILFPTVLTFAYQKWINLEENIRPNSIVLYGVEMDFEFQDLVYPFEYTSKNESSEFPEWLMEWAENDISIEALQERKRLILPASAEEGEEILPTKTRLVVDKIGFLQALGVHINDSLVLMRHYLRYNEGLPITQKQVNDLRQNATVLENTILYLAEHEVTFLFDDERVGGLRKVYNTLENIQNLPLLYFTSPLNYDDSLIEPFQEAVYGLKRFYEDELYNFDAKQQSILAEKYGISLERVLEAVGKEGTALTNIELKGIEPKTSKIEEILSLETLQASSQEWGASHYMKWREEVPYRVYLYAGEMPYQLRFCDTMVATFERDSAVLCEEIVYVNQNAPNIEEELFKITKSATLSEFTVLQLLRYKNETVKETQHTIIEKITETVVERVVEQVVVEDALEEDEEMIENPDIQAVITAKNQRKGKLKLTIDLEDLPTELLEEIMQYAQKSKVIMKK